jgi:hypothetical protein
MASAKREHAHGHVGKTEISTSVLSSSMSISYRSHFHQYSLAAPAVLVVLTIPAYNGY